MTKTGQTNQTQIRNYHPSDLTALYRICLKTGNSGKDASDLYKNPDLLGHFYAAPYAVLEPDLCFVVISEGIPCGYILGTRDTVPFCERCDTEWFPVLREQYPLPAEEDTSTDARIIRLIHKGHWLNEDLAAYPAHLHIDLLPQIQGQGMGRKLVDAFVKRLNEIGVHALHLQVGKANPGAIAFYQRTGFHVIKDYELTIAFGMVL
jgi:ribosomal protein S18 acetylase RimI-like enzyme